MGSGVTYAAANTSLWGTIDEPVKPKAQIQKEQKEAEQKQEQQQQEILAQETVCELLSAQPTLSGDTANAKFIREALQKTYEKVMPEYKMFLVSVSAANNLYMKYREQYLKSYCKVGQ